MTSEEYDKLTEEEKRIKVAELAGWKHVYHRQYCWATGDGKRDPSQRVLEGRPPDYDSGIYKSVADCHGVDAANALCTDDLPDYLSDLNAMHGAEPRCYETDETWERYCGHLLDAVVADAGYQGADLLVRATAAQRAKAFVLTMTED